MRAPVFLLALAIACSGPLPEEEAPPLQTRQDGILGGTTNFRDPELFFVSARTGPTTGYSCSSTLIGRRTLLTAAHCVTRQDDGGVPTVRFNNKPSAADARTDAGEVFFAVDQKRHPGFNDNNLQHDVGVFLLDRPPPVKPKEWNRMTMMETLVGQNVRAAGYGLTGDTAPNGVKREVTTPLLGAPPTVLTFGGRGVAGICNGDSGGPAFMTFPDGKERLAAVHSYTKTECGDGASVRVDQEQVQIDAWLDLYEGAKCGDDGLCKTGCMPVDTDCLCPKDGMCPGTCPSPARDPDCADSCAGNGVCSAAPCATADPDCAVLGGDCNDDTQCNSRRCINDPQHSNYYCSIACAVPADCPSDMACSGGQCIRRQLPTASKGQGCTPSETFCTGATVCDVEDGGTGTCVQPCLVNADCTPQFCKIGMTGFGRCADSVTLPAIKGSYAAAGCESAPGLSLIGLVAIAIALAYRRRRRF